ncbi:MAG: hypothetical protein QOI47_625, partial [Actinomycetota bacterium]|nr:hypothetical protein [Actinomycetota bacterium]
MSVATAPGAPGRRLRARLDRVVDALQPAALRARALSIARRTGITRTGAVALVGFVLLWIMARVVAGTAMYLFAYGLLLLLGVSYLISPRNLKLEGVRDGLFPRVQEGDRLDVELKLTARRRITTFVLEEQVPERLGRRVRVPVTRLSSGGEV